MDDRERVSSSSAWRRTKLTIGCLHVPQSSLRRESLTKQRRGVQPARSRGGGGVPWRCTLMNRAYWRSPAFNYPYLLEDDERRTIYCVRGIIRDSLSGTES